MNQTDLADQLGVTQPTISRTLKGRMSPETQRKALLLLGIRPVDAGLPPSVSDWLDPDKLAMAGNIVAMARQLRNAGCVREAEEGFAPTLGRLEQAYRAGQADPDLALLLCEARATNATIVGDLASEKGHRQSANGAGQALQIGRVYGNPALHAQLLNLRGNQLRVVGDLAEAREALNEAATVGGTTEVLAATHAWIARVAAEQGDDEGFSKAARQSRALIEAGSVRTPLVNNLSITEIEARGLLQLEQVKEAQAKLDELDSIDGVHVAPQWNVLLGITRGEALVAAGDVAEGIVVLRHAAAEAERLELPHQLERIVRAAGRATTSDAIDLRVEVERSLNAKDAG